MIKKSTLTCQIVQDMLHEHVWGALPPSCPVRVCVCEPPHGPETVQGAERREAVEAAAAPGRAWFSVDGDETGQRYSGGARRGIRLDLNIALECRGCLALPTTTTTTKGLQGVLERRPNPWTLLWGEFSRHPYSASADLGTVELVELELHILRLVSSLKSDLINIREALCEIKKKALKI